MNEFNRRKFLEGSAGMAAAASLGVGTTLFTTAAHGQST
ncbi:MAG: twin-arginine translocation signal domain-containing protein, partial [Proteobacteria bacterium]|nr:twin-arginine translocation signal domain-containing protein [Pseudomonadota bacterium]